MLSTSQSKKYTLKELGWLFGRKNFHYSDGTPVDENIEVTVGDFELYYLSGSERA